MEYIEPKPKEVKPHAKRNKTILVSFICAGLALSVAVGVFFLVSKVFINYDNVEIYTFNYDNSDPKSEARISSIKESVALPKKLRLPSKFKGHPVTAIDDQVFAKREELVKIVLPNSLKTIGNECFKDCKNLKQINVPKDLEVVGTDAFYNTAWLESKPENGPVEFGSWLYTYKGKMTANSAILMSEDSPSASKYTGVKIYLNHFKNFSRGVFKNQTNLVYAEFPNDFTYIQESLFDGCTGLKEVMLSENTNSIGNYAFRNCSSLHIDNFGELSHLKKIGEYSFASSRTTGELYFPDSLYEVGEGAFQKCESLTKVSIGNGFEFVPDHAFEDCRNLEEVKFPARENSPESHITYIGDYAFKGTAISEFHIPFNVLDVRMYAFCECPNLTSVYAYSNTTNTASNSFDAESKTWSVTPDSPQGIIKFGIYAFNNASSFKELLLVNKDNEVISTANEVSIPKTVISLGGRNEEAFFFTGTAIQTLRLGGAAVAYLPPSFAEYALDLEVVDFGSGDAATVTDISRNAFRGCTKIASITLPENTAFQTNAFENCTSLTGIVLSSNAKSVTAGAFKGCTKLNNVVIPKKYTSLGKEAFMNCTSLDSFTFETNSEMNNILESVFEGCTALTTVAFPENVGQFNAKVFKGCTSLSSVSMPLRAYIVTQSMFEGCTALTTLVLPSNFTTIQSNAFANSGLKDLTVAYNSKINAFAGAFTNVHLDHLRVPSGIVHEYQEDANWTAIVDPANIVAID
ncbi:MAG: leucine-rich repeat domain-containing protein [Bacilli bacterium]|nr:leucine-rich repeat domain-containing protein [Bacilli bacterium]